MLSGILFFSPLRLAGLWISESALFKITDYTSGLPRFSSPPAPRVASHRQGVTAGVSWNKVYFVCVTRLGPVEEVPGTGSLSACLSCLNDPHIETSKTKEAAVV